MTKDGVLVLIHDEMIDRTTNGTGYPSGYNYNDLRKLDAGSWFSGKFKDEKIPTADELHSPFYAVENSIVSEIHKEGIDVNVYTVNQESLMKNMIDAGVDGIITNFPGKLRKILKE